MSVDTLGTGCDQCVSMVQYCFTSTEITRLVRPRTATSTFCTAPECFAADDEVELHVSDVG